MRTALIIATLTALAACSSGHREPFGDATPVVRDLAGLYGELHKSVESSNNLTLREIGNIAYGSFISPILHIAYRVPATKGKRSKILIDAGVHGNEPAGVAFVSRLIARLADGTSPLRGYDIDVLPVVNPWGWSRDIRFNRDGIDINRDFSSPRSQEAKIIKDFLKGSSYDLVLDLHEDPDAKGVYFYQYGRSDTELLKTLIASIRSSGYVIENATKMILLKTKDGILDAPMWGLWYVNLTNQLSMSNFCRIYLSGNVFTLETPTDIGLEKRIAVHQRAVLFLSDSLLRGKQAP